MQGRMEVRVGAVQRKKRLQTSRDQIMVGLLAMLRSLDLSLKAMGREAILGLY